MRTNLAVRQSLPRLPYRLQKIATTRYATGLAKGSLRGGFRLETSERAVGQILTSVRSYLRFRSDRELKCARFLDELMAAQTVRDAEADPDPDDTPLPALYKQNGPSYRSR